ncbi:hypothetical protein [Arthrobacter sp. KK5.5]|uniref:hypothetical protein n=1 Tax=Arthrobacter sp. KK5.5 TaxID=3373084 RepID=UPI003EE69E3F
MPRRTLLIILEKRLLRDAISEGLELAERYRELPPGVPEGTESELYAVGEAARIQRRTKPPRTLASPSPAGTGVGPIHAIWAGGQWLTPAGCSPAPPDANGATDWQWAHYNAVMDADRGAHLLLWDLYWKAEEDRMAA